MACVPNMVDVTPQLGLLLDDFDVDPGNSTNLSFLESNFSCLPNVGKLTAREITYGKPLLPPLLQLPEPDLDVGTVLFA